MSEETPETAEAGSEGPQPVESETGSEPKPHSPSEPSKAESQSAKAPGRKSSASDISPFAEGEKVLAYHGPMIYGAKVIGTLPSIQYPRLYIAMTPEALTYLSDMIAVGAERLLLFVKMETIRPLLS